MILHLSHLNETLRNLQLREFNKEFIFQTSRSSGPGGQNVNKTETKVELRFDVQNSSLLNEEEKEIIFEKLKNRINNEGYLCITSQESRSQLTNKLLTEDIFYELIAKAIKKQKVRKATKPTFAANKRRLITKKYNSQKKELRNNKISFD